MGRAWRMQHYVSGMSEVVMPRHIHVAQMRVRSSCVSRVRIRLLSAVLCTQWHARACCGSGTHTWRNEQQVLVAQIQPTGHVLPRLGVRDSHF